MPATSAYAEVVTSPATCTWPVVIRVSTATRLLGSSARRASRIESLIWSAILSGWPSVTDSEVNRRRDTGLLAGCGSVGRKSLTVFEVGPARPDQVPDRVGRGFLRSEGYVGARAVGAQDHGGVLRSLEPGGVPAAADLVDDEQVGALGGQLGPAVGQRVTLGGAGLGGEADHHLSGPGPRRPRDLGQHVGGADQGHRVGLAGALRDLGVLGV